MKRVLITPLDWGLGHATRCIPIINELIHRGCEVMIAGSGDSLSLLKSEFPSLKFFFITGYDPVYPLRGKSMVWKMITQLPKFLHTIKTEHHEIETIAKNNRIDFVISDNRYGCWSAEVPSVFITHQSNIMMPEKFGWLQNIVRKRNEHYMKRFTRCWLPDFPEEHSLAGDLISFGKKPSGISIDYIGGLSRFKPSTTSKKEYDVVAIFSGPEPQRSLLEEIVLPQLQRSGLKYFVVGGVLSALKVNPDPNYANFLTSQNLQHLIESSSIVIARSGYSTIMDLAALRKKVVFIPTPGQTEQEYLANRLFERGIALCVKQDNFNLSSVLEKAKKFSGFVYFSSDKDLLALAVDNLFTLKTP